MYLYRREYVGGWDFQTNMDREGERELYDNIVKVFGHDRLEASPHVYVDICVAYWRKANAIHGWFVNELAKGVDNCQDIYVSRNDLIKLRDLAKTALLEPSIAGDILPPTSGFFFGSYDIDEWYMDDMRNTVKQIDKVLKQSEEHSYFYYKASW